MKPTVIVRGADRSLVKSLEDWLAQHYPDVPVEHYAGFTEAYQKSILRNEVEAAQFSDPKNIIRIEGNRNYSMLYLKDGRIMKVSRNLKGLEAILSQPSFIRIHKSHIINVNALIRIRKSNGRQVQMLDGCWIPISDKGWIMLQGWVSKHLF